MAHETVIRAALVVGKTLVALIFLLNALGVVDQAGAARELAGFGVPRRWVPLAMLTGRGVQLVGAILLVLWGDRLAALGCVMLAAFLAQATLVAHPFWSATGDARTPQLVNFLKNVAIIGGLLSLASVYV